MTYMRKGKERYAVQVEPKTKEILSIAQIRAKYRNGGAFLDALAGEDPEKRRIAAEILLMCVVQEYKQD